MMPTRTARQADGRVRALAGLAGALAIVCSAGAASAAVYYVEPSHPAASDTHPGTDPERPWKTHAHAAQRVGAGDEVRLVGGGHLRPLRPWTSGTADRPLVFRATGAKPVELVSGGTDQPCILMKDVRHVIVDGVRCDADLENGRPSGLQHWIVFSSAGHTAVQNSVFSGTPQSDGVKFLAGSAHNRLSGNRLEPVYPDFNRETIVLQAGAQHNLIQDNVVTDGGHNALQVRSSYNVIRNNRFTNPNYRAVEFIAELGSGDPVAYNVFEGNHVHDARVSANAMQHWVARTIIRRNRFYRNDGIGLKITRPPDHEKAPDISRNRVYHNVFWSNGRKPPTADSGVGFRFEVRGVSGKDHDNRFLNNALLDNNDLAEHQVHLHRVGEVGTARVTLAGNVVRNRRAGDGVLLLEGLGNLTLAEAAVEYPAFVYTNRDADPAFCDPSASPPDFRPRVGSPLIDSGSWLTRVVAPGGALVTDLVRVEDSRVFTDGNGIVDGDVVQFERSGARRVVRGVDHGTGTLVLDETVQVRDGEGVALAFEGAGPDVGAFEVAAGDAGCGATLSAPGRPAVLGTPASR